MHALTTSFDGLEQLAISVQGTQLAYTPYGQLYMLDVKWVADSKSVVDKA